MALSSLFPLSGKRIRGEPMRRWFSMEGSLYEWLNRLGNLTIVSLLFLAGCLPVITIGDSMIALYYATAKTVRFETGYPAKEFWRAYKRNLLRGIGVTLWVALLLFMLYYGQVLPVILLSFVLPLYIPAASRFSLAFGKVLELSFVMSVRYFYFTLLLLAAVVLLAAAQFFLLPWVTVAVLPGLACYGMTFITERVLRAYTPKPGEGQARQWYDQ